MQGDHERQCKSACIVSSIERLEKFQSAKTVLLFSPLPDEPDIRPLLSRYVSDKTIFLPVVVGENLILRQLHDAESMQVGAFGIKEPSEGEFCNFGSIDVAIIPGVAFDLRGNRLGRGRGYYDKLLGDVRFRNVVKIGCAFGFQIANDVPALEYDVKMDAVVCENGVWFS